MCMIRWSAESKARWDHTECYSPPTHHLPYGITLALVCYPQLQVHMWAHRTTSWSVSAHLDVGLGLGVWGPHMVALPTLGRGRPNAYCDLWVICANTTLVWWSAATMVYMVWWWWSAPAEYGDLHHKSMVICTTRVWSVVICTSTTLVCSSVASCPTLTHLSFI